MDPQVTARTAEKYFGTRNTSLLDLPLEVIEYILPHLPPHSFFALSLASKAFYNLIFPPSGSRQCTRIWRHLSLADPKGYKEYNPRSLVPGEKLKAYLQTPEVLLSKPYVLQHTRTLILDGSPTVTVPLISTLLLEDGISQSHRIEILSIRTCPAVNDQELAISLRRISTKIAPSLKGIYYFSDPALDQAPSPGVSEFVSPAMTKLLGLACRTRDEAEARRGGWWAVTMQALSGRVCFDAELCRGNDHYVQREGRPRLCLPKIATMRVSEGCGGCGVCPSSEEFVKGISGVLYPPVPLHSSSVARAMSTRHFARHHNFKTMLLCTACLGQRYCKGCTKWWCGPCSTDLTAVDPKPFVRMDCFECGYMCGECNRGHSRSCEACSGHYCIVHNDGSDEQLCEWCNLSSYHNRKRRASISKDADRPKVLKAATVSSSGSSAAGPSRSPLTEVDKALHNAAYFSDPAGMISGSSTYLTTAFASSASSSAAIPRTPQSPCMSSTLVAPVIIMGSSSTAASTIAAGGKGKQRAAAAAAWEQQPATPNLKPVGVGKGAGMRLRTMVVLGEKAASDRRWLAGRSKGD